MNMLKVFEKAEFGRVRVVECEGEPWFVAKDVCECLELTDVSKTISLLDDDEKGTNSIRTPGGEQQMLVVSEPGLYSLILRSRKPEAKAFKRWIIHEVVPSIRKRGLYATEAVMDRILDDPDFGISLLQQYKFEREQRKLVEARRGRPHQGGNRLPARGHGDEHGKPPFQGKRPAPRRDRGQPDMETGEGHPVAGRGL